jgi:hypothetical protein
VSERWQSYPAGTVRQSTETIELKSLGGGHGIGRGVTPHRYKSHFSVSASTQQTEETSSLGSIECHFGGKEENAFLIEWIDNLSAHYMWPDLVDFESVETSTETIGRLGSHFVISGSGKEMSSGRAAMQLTVGGVEFALVKNDGKKRKKRLGRIIYRSCPHQEIRDRIRDCLSFVLGLPIVCYGHTTFSENWRPTQARAMAAFSIHGEMFRLHEQPPFPIHDRQYLNMFDPKKVESIANIIFQNYDTLSFRDLSWSYWHAMCAPTHIAAVHFGAVIEQFQRATPDVVQASRRGMLNDDAWRNLRTKMREAFATAEIPVELRDIMKNKVDGLNQPPQGIVLKRLLERLGLTIGDVETRAWKHRNLAAHGHIDKDHIEVILNSKALRILFHRMLAGVTYCSDSYVDYYNLDFLTRLISEPIPSR